jgi:hypothetical protein
MTMLPLLRITPVYKPLVSYALHDRVQLDPVSKYV